MERGTLSPSRLLEGILFLVLIPPGKAPEEAPQSQDGRREIRDPALAGAATRPKRLAPWPEGRFQVSSSQVSASSSLESSRLKGWPPHRKAFRTCAWGNPPPSPEAPTLETSCPWITPARKASRSDAGGPARKASRSDAGGSSFTLHPSSFILHPPGTHAAAAEHREKGPDDGPAARSGRPTAQSGAILKMQPGAVLRDRNLGFIAGAR